MWRCVNLVKTDVSAHHITTFRAEKLDIEEKR
jgi:hypothetical protein